MSSEYGEQIKISIFGQSHAQGIGVVIDGLPAGEAVDLEALQAFLDRRRPGQGLHTTARKEGGVPKILSGLVDGRTCGAPLCAVIENTDTRSQDYQNVLTVPRPGHADYPAWVKWGGHNDIRGGGHFSGRLTAPLCIAGGILLQLYSRRGIAIGAHIDAIAGVKDTPFHPVEVTAEQLHEVSARRPLAVVDEDAGRRMLAAIYDASAYQDSVGGTVECCVLGLPVGLGGPMFDGLENLIARAVFGIPAVKGIEFGAGFAAAKLRGSANNDPFRIREGKVVTEGNHHGGILGGLSTGMPLLFRCAFKPTPSISRPQPSVDLSTMEETELVIKGRHDPCVVTRAVPCVEAAAAIALADVLLGKESNR